MIGTTISHFKILEKLGAGGMGVVYKAHDHRLDRFVALKFLPPHLAASEEDKKRFTLEAKAASALDHPNICTIYEIADWPVEPASGDAAEPGGSRMFMAMAYYEGATLQQQIEASPNGLPLGDAIDITIQICAGLRRAHESTIVHRDIKPANVIVTSRGDVKIVDFGLAKLANRTLLTKEGSTLGTVAYMSPEQSKGEEVDHRTDIWAVGVMLYEMLSGKRPFGGEYDQALVYSILNEQAAPISSTRGDMPPALQHILEKCLAKNPDNRYPTVEALLEDLVQLTQSHATAHPSQTKAHIGRRPVTYLGIGLALVLAGFATLDYFMGGETSPPSVGGDAGNRIAVFPFTVRGTPEYSYLGEGMAELLSANLDGAGSLKSINMRTLLRVISRESAGGDAGTDAPRIAGRVDAGLFLRGSILEAGGKLRVTASLYRTTEAGEPLATAGSEGHVQTLFELTDDLTAQIIAGISQQPAERLTRLATRTTGSFTALKAFLEGEKYRRGGRIQEAATAYQRAVAEDSTFALAYYRLVEVAGYSPLGIDRRTAMQAALRHSGQLSERNRMLLEAFSASRKGDPAPAEELYRKIVSQYPDEVDAHVALGHSLMSYAGQRSVPLDDAVAAFEGALAYDPDNLPAVPFLWIMSIWRGDEAMSDSLARRLGTLVSLSEKSLQNLTWLAFSTGDSAEQERMIAEAGSANAFEVTVISSLLCHMRSVHRSPRRFANAVRFIQQLTHGGRTADQRFIGYLILANLNLSAGRWQAADSALTGAESIFPLHGLRYRVLMSLIPEFQVGEMELGTIHDRVLAAKGDTPYDTLFRWYLGLLLNARLEDAPEAQRCADTLAAVASRLTASTAGPRIVALAADLVRATSILLAKNETEVDAALALAEQQKPGAWMRPGVTGYLELQVYERTIRADRLMALQRPLEALPIYRALKFGNYTGGALAALSFRKEAQALERIGRAEQAAARYARFIELWQMCDPALQPLVDDARLALARLTPDAVP